MYIGTFLFLFTIVTIKLLHSCSEDDETDRIPLQYVGLIVMEVTKVSRQKPHSLWSFLIGQFRGKLGQHHIIGQPQSYYQKL